MRAGISMPTPSEDLIEHSRAEVALARELADSQILQHVSNQLVSASTASEHYAKIVEAARALMRSDAASIQEYQDSRLKLVAHVGFHPDSAQFWEWVGAESGSACGRALLANERYVIADTGVFDAEPDELEAFRKSDIVSVQSTPLVSRNGKIVGMISTHWRQPDGGSGARYASFDILARLAADFIERTRADEALRLSEERYRTLFDSIDEGYAVVEVLRDANGRAIDLLGVEINRAYTEKSGIPPTFVGRRFGEFAKIEDRWLKAYDDVVRTGVPLRMEDYWADGQRWVTAHISRVGGAGSNLVATVFDDISARKRAELALRESEERVRMALDAGRMGTWSYDLATGRQQWSAQQFRLFGLEPGGTPPTRELFMSLVHPEDHHLVEFGPDDLAPGRGLLDAEFRIVRPDGETRWLVAHTVVRRDVTGAPIEMIGLNWDITESRRAAEHQQLLTAELQHRVRNTLAVIRAIARRTAQSSDNVEALAMNLEGRIDAFARVQAAVTRDPVGGVDFATLLVEELRAAAAHEGESVSVDGPPVRLKPKAAETIALGFHELVTNAIKYGALSRERARLRACWSFEGSGAQRRLRFSWKETGMKGLTASTRTGLGTEVLTRTLPYELSAHAELTITEDGVAYDLAMPNDVLIGT
jgi:two-component sensor histidine kinase